MMDNDLLPSSTGLRRPREWTSLVAAVVLGVVTLGLFWPIVRQIGSVLYDRSDSVLNTWILSWQAHILMRQPLDLFAAPIFYPLRASLAFSEIIWPAAPLAVPLLAISDNPVLVFNLLYLGNFFLAGLGMFLLARKVITSPLAALLAGFIYAFSSHQFGHLSQIQLLSIGFLPLVLIALDRFWRLQRGRDGLLLVCFVAFQSLSAFYYAFQVALVIGVYLSWVTAVMFLSARSGKGHAESQEGLAPVGLPMVVHDTLTRFGRITLWGVVAAVVILPFTLPYFSVRAEFGLQRSLGEAQAFSPPLIDYLIPRNDNPLFAGLFATVPGLDGLDAGGLFLGVTATLLALIGFATWNRRQLKAQGQPTPSPLAKRWLWLALFCLAVLLSLGPQLKIMPGDPGGMNLPFQWLFLHVPGFTAMRAPGRFAVTAFLALAMLAAAGAAWLLAHISNQRLRMMLAGVLGTLIIAEYAAGLVPVTPKVMPDLRLPPPVVVWLAEQPPTIIIELPLTNEMAFAPISAPPLDEIGGRGTGAHSEASDFLRAWPDFNMFRYQYFATAHWQPSVDGYTGFVPPHHRELGLSMAQFPSERSLAILHGLGVEYVLLHSQLMDDFQPGRAASLRQALTATEYVEHVHDFGLDWVYRVLPYASPSVSGQLWATATGDAFLLLKTQATGTHVYSPIERLSVHATWQPAGGGHQIEQFYSVNLPLAVSATSVVPLELNKPEVGGSYTLTLQAQNPAFPTASQQQLANIQMDSAPVLLMPVQLMETSIPQDVMKGDTITVELHWRLLDRPASDVSVGLHVLDGNGDKIVNDDQALSGGHDLVRQWQPGMILTTTHSLPLLSPEEEPLTLRVFFYRPDVPDDFWFLDAEETPVREILLPLRLSRTLSS